MPQERDKAGAFRRLGEAARLAHEAVQMAFKARVRERDPDHYAALLKIFHAATAAALPSSKPNFMQGLAEGATQHVEAAICFLEADPWFFRSGYEKQALIRHLKRALLDAHQRDRLGAVVLAAIDGRDRPEFRHFCRLACGIWSDSLDEGVATRMTSADPGIRRRAIWVAQAAIDANKA